METTTAAPLTFGDTFTLPVTGDLVWTIRDSRPPFAHLERKHDAVGLGHTAYAKCETDEGAFYTPGGGWTVPSIERKREAIVEQLNALDVHLPRRTAEGWSAEYRRMLGKETRHEIAAVVALAEDWTRKTDIDVLDLKAHIAATAALTAAGTRDNLQLYTAVYNATLATLREEQTA